MEMNLDLLILWCMRLWNQTIVEHKMCKTLIEEQVQNSSTQFETYQSGLTLMNKFKTFTVLKYLLGGEVV